MSNLNFASNESSERYKVSSKNMDSSEIEVHITKLTDGHYVINVQNGCAVALTLVVDKEPEVWDYWGWGD